MAAALTITGFHDAVDYKVIKCTAIEDATVVVNASGSSGTLYAAYLDSSGTSTNVFLHILDGKDTSNSEITMRGVGTQIKTLQIPTGFAFDMLNFRVSVGGAEDNAGDFDGTVAVTLVCS